MDFQQIVQNNECVKKILEEKTEFINDEFKQSFYDQTIENIKFDECTFINIEIKKLTFSGCYFKKCLFSELNMVDVKFSKCTFEGTNFIDCRLKIEFNQGTKVFTSHFINCNNEFDIEKENNILKNNASLHSLIGGAELIERKIDFDSIDIFATDFNNTNLDFAKFEKCRFCGVEFYNNTSLYNTRIIKVIDEFSILFRCESRKRIRNTELSINDYYVKFNDQTLFPEYKDVKLLMKKADSRKLLGLINSYEEIIVNAKKNNIDANLIGDCLYTYKSMLLKTMNGKNKIQAIIVKYLNGFGEKWYRGLFWSLFVIFLFAFIYLSGLQVNSTLASDSRIIGYKINFTNMINMDWLKIMKDYGCCLYFSMMTFTTVGYGNMQPIGMITNLFSFIQMFIGVILMTITTGTLLRRIMR